MNRSAFSLPLFPLGLLVCSCAVPQAAPAPGKIECGVVYGDLQTPEDGFPALLPLNLFPFEGETLLVGPYNALSIREVEVETERAAGAESSCLGRRGSAASAGARLRSSPRS